MRELPEVRAAWLSECAKADIELEQHGKPNKVDLNPHEIIPRNRPTEEEKRERKRLYQIEYRKKHRTELRENAKKYYTKKPPKKCKYHDPDYQRKYCESHREQVNTYHRKYSAKKKAAASLQTDDGTVEN